MKLKWIGQHIWDLYSLFRERVHINRTKETTHDYNGSNGSDVDPALRVNVALSKDLQDSEQWGGTGVRVAVTDTTTGSHANSGSWLTGQEITVKDNDADGSKTVCGMDIQTFGGDFNTGLKVSGEVGTGSAAGYQCLYLKGYGSGTTSGNQDVRIVSKNHQAKSMTLHCGDNGEGTIRTWETTSGSGTSSYVSHLNLVADGDVYFRPRGTRIIATPPMAYDIRSIKIMPNEFMLNDGAWDGGGVAYMTFDDDLGTMGVKISNLNSELVTFVKIPSNFKVTHIEVHGTASTSNACKAYSYNYTTGARSAAFTYQFDINQLKDITDINGGATNDLCLVVDPAAVTDVIFGATVIIANQ